MKSILVTRADLSYVLDLSENSITKFVNSGVFHKPAKRGAFDLAACVRAYLRHSRSNARSSLSDERTRWTKAKADRAELDLRARAGELVEVDEMKQLYFEKGRQVRDALMGIADRIAGIVSAESNQTKNHATISKEIRQALEALTS